jgi:DNA-binding GntR family transcriptional regulator
MAERHRPIVDAIRQRDGAGGQRYIAAHVGDVASTIVEQRAEVAARATSAR